MKIYLLRYIVALVLWSTSLVAFATTGTILESTFSGFPTNLGNNVEHNGWLLQQAAYVTNNVNALYVTGYVKTPELGTLAGDAELSFDYKSSKNNGSSLVEITIEGAGTFSNGHKSMTTDAVGSQNFVSTGAIAISDGDATTRIKFSRVVGSDLFFMTNLLICGEMVETAQSTAPPTFSLAEDYYKTAQTLVMSCATEGATIYYTTDGTAPTDQSTQYTGEISIGETQTVKAIAYKGETASEVASAYYYVGDFLYADAFTANEHGDSTVASSFVLSNLNIGRSAILTFRAKGTTASSTLNVRALENNEGTPICDKTIDLTKDVWQSDTIALPTLKEGSTMTIYFNNGNFAIDDILLVTPLTITLSENASNTETLQNNRGKIVDVATVRTLRGGIWNTLCLPFAVSRSVLYTGIGGSQNCYITTYDHFADNIMTFRTAAGAEVIPAGTPFLVKIDNTVTNPVFRAVTITVTAPLFIADGGVTFQGCFNPTPLEYNGTDLFIGTDNFLYVPAEATRTLGGLRAFVHRANSQTRLSLAFDDETTAIRQADILPAEAEALYTLQGQRVVSPGRGLYIKDGKKIFIK